MTITRRDYLRISGLGGLGLAGQGLLQGWAGDTDAAPSELPAMMRRRQRDHIQRFNMSGFTAPPLDKVRIGIIGLGQRGPAHMITMTHVEGTEIKALCDIRPEKAAAARKQIEGTAHAPDILTGPEDWKRVCERPDIDLVILTTPWYMHAMMAVYAMEHGKHVASEVPAAGTIEECWRLVETAERADMIDKARAQRAKESAEATLAKAPKEDADYERARIALMRAITRISVADKSSSAS